MEQYDNLNIVEMPLGTPFFRDMVSRFLGANGLRMEAMDSYYTIQDPDGNILAGAGISSDIIKCVAVSGNVRSEGLVAPLISRIISGRGNLKVFTKPEYRVVFESLGFSFIAVAPEAILLENGKGLEKYCEYLRGFRREGLCGVVVMNANPFTLGHRYLIEKALQQVDTLYVIPVMEDVSMFPYAERKAMLEAAAGEFGDRVIVLEGSGYSISAATFPTYFLKDLTAASETQMRLDLDLFGSHIAPSLGAKVRFVGSEPLAPLTARYNKLMTELLPSHGVEVAVIERCGPPDRTAGDSPAKPGVAPAKPCVGPGMSGVGPDMPCVGPDMPCVGPAKPCVGPDMPCVGPDISSIGPDISSIGPGMSCVGPDISSIGPDMPCVGPGMSGVGPDKPCVGPDISSIGPAKPCVGPDISSIGPAMPCVGPGMSGVGPDISSIGPAKPCVGPDISSIGPAKPGERSVVTGYDGGNAPLSESAPLSASAVREALSSGSFGRAAALCPATTWPYLLAQLAYDALKRELDCPLKPGLVCPGSNGAHTDMSYVTMMRGIDAIRPFFAKMALSATPSELKQCGIEAEAAMMRQTGGVNTHRGAIFALGISLNAIYREMQASGTQVITQSPWGQNALGKTAKALIDSKFHFTAVGARRMALEGYEELFSNWLPFYRDMKEQPYAMQKLLLRIMSTLDDTCILHRAGSARADEVKLEALDLLEAIPGNAVNEGRAGASGNRDGGSDEITWKSALEEMCLSYAREGISPGGAADMLSLTLFFDSVMS